MKPRIAILTTLTDYAPSYSLVGIILDQARSLERNGYEYDLLCLKNFNEKDRDELHKRENLSIRYELPQTLLVDYPPGMAPQLTTGEVLGFEDQVQEHLNGDDDKGTSGYLSILEDYDVVISHDIMFLSWFLPQNAALRKCIDLWPGKNWLHWIHSSPSPQPPGTIYPTTLRFGAAKNSTYVFLNDSQKHDCALMLGTTRDKIATVYNPKDIREVYDFSRETCAMIAAYDLFEHDLMQVYPFSSPRWTMKGIKQLVHLAMNWKRQGIRSKIVLVNANCNSPKDKKYVEAMERYITEHDLKLDEDVIMTSRFADQADLEEWKYCVPQRVIRELVLMSNIFIFPSPKECCSLIHAEASIAGGKFMVLNRECEPMMEFGKSLCLHYKFTLNDPDRKESEQYYTCVAREIWAEFQSESTVMNTTIARRETYNRDWIFKKQFEPLLWKGFSGKVQGKKPEIVSRPIESQRKVELVSASKEKPPIVVSVTGARGGKVTALKKTIQEELRRGRVDYNDPRPGDHCPIFGECSKTQRDSCYKQAGHCPVLDE